MKPRSLKTKVYINRHVLRDNERRRLAGEPLEPPISVRTSRGLERFFNVDIEGLVKLRYLTTGCPRVWIECQRDRLFEVFPENKS